MFFQRFIEKITATVIVAIKPKFDDIENRYKKQQNFNTQVRNAILKLDQQIKSIEPSKPGEPIQKVEPEPVLQAGLPLNIVKSNPSLVDPCLKGITCTSRKLLTYTEYKFFQQLSNACANKFFILTKVGLWALIDNNDDMNLWNRISRKHLDFVLCDKKTMYPVLVIELDDKYHLALKRQKTDAEKDYLLDKIGIPVLRIFCNQSYDERELLDKILEVKINLE